jgi:tetratricopeptide (TPR) repeat protein
MQPVAAKLFYFPNGRRKTFAKLFYWMVRAEPQAFQPGLRPGRPERGFPELLHWTKRVSVRRSVIFALLPAFLAACLTVPAQEAPSAAAAAPASAQQQPVSSEVAAAEAAIAASDWKTAETRLDAWLATNPVDARALFDAGYVADAQSRLDEAAGLYRRAIAANPNSLEAHLSLGLLLARQDKPDEARTELATATTLDPGAAGPALKARAWRALAQIDKPEPGGETDPAAATNDLIEALKISPETEDDTLLAATLAEEAGQFDAAEGAYRRVLAEDPKSEPATTGLAHLLLARKQYPEAETMLRAALAQFPGDPALTAQLATALAAQDKAEALPLLQKLHADHPADAAISRMLAAVLADAGDYEGSDKLYTELLVASPQDPSLLVAHGQNLVRLLRYVDAYAAFDAATKIDGNNIDGWSGLAFAASRMERPNTTIHALTMRSRFAPENASTYFLWATSYDKLRENDQAVAYYEKFLDAAAGKYPNEEWQARQRIEALKK